MSDEILEKKKFTQTAVLFSMTGHIFIRGDASEEYCSQSLAEIKDDAVYRYVMSSVLETMKKSLWEMYDATTKDVDPILKKYLCMKLPWLADKLEETSELTVREALRFLERTCLVNDYIELEPITFEELANISEKVNKELEESEKSVRIL